MKRSRSGHSPFGTNLLFYPLGANLAHHTLAAGFFPLTFLVKKLSGNDPLYPFYAFKIIILFSFTLILLAQLSDFARNRIDALVGAYPCRRLCVLRFLHAACDPYQSSGGLFHTAHGALSGTRL